MRLLVITNDYPPKVGGIQQYLAHLVRHIAGDVCVIAPRDARGGAVQAPRGTVVRAPWRFMWPTPAVTRWTTRTATAFAPDAVLFGAPLPLMLMGPALRRRLGVPYGVLTHGAEVTVPAAVPALRRVAASALRRADVVFATSRHTARAVAQILGHPPCVLGAGVDVATFRPGPRRGPGGRRVIGSVGRFVPRKGQRDVITAVAALRRRGHDAELLLVGGGRLERMLRRHAAALSVPTRFAVDAPWERLPELYREMDVFALPCRTRWLGHEAEGFGMVFLEAAASGLPVIVGDSGGAPETTEDGTSGFVVGDRRGLIEALDALLSDPSAAAAMGARGRARMEREFSWEPVAGRLHAGFEALGARTWNARLADAFAQHEA